MQIITYSVQIIQSNGRVTREENERFLDSVPVKKVQAEVANAYQRAVENVIVTEVSRTTV